MNIVRQSSSFSARKTPAPRTRLIRRRAATHTCYWFHDYGNNFTMHIKGVGLRNVVGTLERQRTWSIAHQVECCRRITRAPTYDIGLNTGSRRYVHAPYLIR